MRNAATHASSAAPALNAKHRGLKPQTGMIVLHRANYAQCKLFVINDERRRFKLLLNEQFVLTDDGSAQLRFGQAGCTMGQRDHHIAMDAGRQQHRHRCYRGVTGAGDIKYFASLRRIMAYAAGLEEAHALCLSGEQQRGNAQQRSQSRRPYGEFLLATPGIDDPLQL